MSHTAISQDVQPAYLQAKRHSIQSESRHLHPQGLHPILGDARFQFPYIGLIAPRAGLDVFCCMSVATTSTPSTAAQDQPATDTERCRTTERTQALSLIARARSQHTGSGHRCWRLRWLYCTTSSTRLLRARPFSSALLATGEKDATPLASKFSALTPYEVCKA